MRLLGVEDGSFEAFQRDIEQYTMLCGVVWTPEIIEDVRLAKVTVDGMDSTDSILELMRGLEVDAVILGGVTFAGFNVINVLKIHSATGTPVIIYISTKPNVENIRKALQTHFKDWKDRYSLIRAVEPIHIAVTHLNTPLYYESVGCDSKWAEKILKDSILLSSKPEPIRIAKLIARGLTRR